MSDIPTVDAAVELARPVGHDSMPRIREYVPVEFARQLERENAALREDKERLNWLLTYEGGSWLYWAIENGEWTPEVAASRAAIDANRKEAQS